MGLTVRQRETITRMAGYVTNPLHVKYRVWRGREQAHVIGDMTIILPPEHNLPFYQRRDPTYDTYAIGLLSARATGSRRVTVIDVGANVGDTAAAILSSDEDTRVICVEGAPRFVQYLKRNLRGMGARATVVEGFVGPVGSNVEFSMHGSTGGFRAGGDDAQAVTRWVRPAELLDMTDHNDLVVWKSDVDGFDIHVLANHWTDIDERADVIWFEFDTPGTLGDSNDVDALIEALIASERHCLVYDNLGRLMVDLAPGCANGLATLSNWLHQQRQGHVTVPYLDVWALTPEAYGLLESPKASGTKVNSGPQ